jgi:hypothetical protein
VRKRLSPAGILAVVAICFAMSGSAVGVAAAADGQPPVAQIACMQATIGGQSKCIARGQYCARAHARDYRRYGLSCTKRDVNGRYHLQ